MNIGEVLHNEVNSALVTFENHCNDNSFLDSNIVKFERGLNRCGIEPIGICKNVPFKPSCVKYSVAFCYMYKDEEELRWCHLSEIVWFNLLSDVYGREKADEIISKIMGYRN